ncbi:CPBP family intramembrane glutamic endopeptidase [Shouchella sp. 1P09AA]|uniref:CPBP family intramembrane glutamic endopeptidase n=1 Tax=unclassified Shouchella TaxID=2893065 RepID=UPI0039A2357F
MKFESYIRKRTFHYLLLFNGIFFISTVIFMYPSPSAFIEFIGVGQPVPLLGWLLALTVASLYAAYTLYMIPETRHMVFEISMLKLLAIPLAVLSGVVEEAFFRKVIMDALEGIGLGSILQVLISALIFSFVHVVWVVFAKDWRYLFAVFVSTFVLGIGLGCVYLLSDRNILPAIVAHIFINLLIEPGLLYSAFRQGMSKK